MRVPYLDYRVPDPAERTAYLAAMEAILREGDVILGVAVAELERRLAAYCGSRYAVGVGSGTEALVLAMQALGIGPGDEVITTCWSYIGTANAIALTGATPVFVDIGDDCNLDPALVAAAITPRSKAIMPVHFAGQLCDMAQIRAVADRHGLPVIEDAAQAIGAADPQGRRAGSFGLMGCLSLNPMKILKAFGEGGMVLTDDATLRDRLSALRDNRYAEIGGRIMPGHNGRLDTIQAAALLIRFENLEATIARRRQIAGRYSAALADVILPPRQLNDYRDVYYNYTLQTDRRDALQVWLTEQGIGTRIQYGELMPDQPAFRTGAPAAYARGRAAAERVLSLPCYEQLTEEQIGWVISAVRNFFTRNAI
jgi:dTDP-4-amino-4,6-dideoxygalactose transaminase